MAESGTNSMNQRENTAETSPHRFAVAPMLDWIDWWKISLVAAG
jgi:hypothetical protein